MTRRSTVRVDDRQWRRLKRKLLGLNRKHVKVGVLGREGGDDQRDGGITMVELAAVHEFGSEDGHIPERSYIRRTMKEKDGDFSLFSRRLATQVIERGMTAERALGLLGAKASSEVKKTITSGKGVPPPNAPSTVQRKGSSRPLVDEGRLVDSITWSVDNE